MAHWYSPDEARADCVAQIVTDLTSCLVTGPNGQTTLDVQAFMALAATREVAIPDPGDASYTYINPTVLRSTNVRPYADELVARLEAITAAATGGSTSSSDVASLIGDVATKAQAVTDYFSAAYSTQILAFVSGNLTSGALEQNMPAADSMTLETRYYRTTFVNDWENESAPSDVSAEVNVGTKDTVTITVGAVPSGRNLNYWRVYRSAEGHEAADWQYVPNAANVLGVPIATTTFTDDVKNSALEEECPSLLWDAPPAALSGVVDMANGIHVGFVGNTLYPTPAYVPWAYPGDYKFTVAWPVVGIAAWEESLFVGTRGKPYFVTGSDPANLKAGTRKLDSNQACASARSVCSTASGVVYASPDGLCLATPAGVQILTAQHFTREEWQALGPSRMEVREHDNVVYFYATDLVPASSTYTWAVFDSQAGVTLSNSNADWSFDSTLYGSGNGRSTRTNVALSGKVYCEFQELSIGAAVFMAFGITSLATPAVFYQAGSYNFFSQNAGSGGCGLGRAGVSNNGSNTTNVAYAFTPATRIGLAVDATAGKMWVSFNGTWLSGDPAAGTSPSFTFTPGTWYFLGSSYTCTQNAPTIDAARIVPNADSMVYALPAGFSPYQP